MGINKPESSQDYSPVEHAVTYGNLPAVRYLLDHGTYLHQQRSGNITLLHSAAAHGHSEIVKYLLSRGVDVDVLSVIGTPLALAAHETYATIVKILLQYNADGGANVRGAGPCYDPLVLAPEKGLTEAIKCLLEAGANPNVLEEVGNFVKKRMTGLNQQPDEGRSI